MQNSKLSAKLRGLRLTPSRSDKGRSDWVPVVRGFSWKRHELPLYLCYQLTEHCSERGCCAGPQTNTDHHFSYIREQREVYTGSSKGPGGWEAGWSLSPLGLSMGLGRVAGQQIFVACILLMF